MRIEKNRPPPVGSGYLETLGEENYISDQKEDYFALASLVQRIECQTADKGPGSDYG